MGRGEGNIWGKSVQPMHGIIMNVYGIRVNYSHLLNQTLGNKIEMKVMIRK